MERGQFEEPSVRIARERETHDQHLIALWDPRGLSNQRAPRQLPIIPKLPISALSRFPRCIVYDQKRCIREPTFHSTSNTDHESGRRFVTRPISISPSLCCISEAEFRRHSSGPPTRSRKIACDDDDDVRIHLLRLVGLLCVLGSLVVNPSCDDLERCGRRRLRP